MTAEVAILNPHAVALAADSAVTVTYGEGQSKIRQSANKIFSLSRFHPVGIMIYAAGSMNGIPWETAVKVYRRQLGDRCFGTVKEYAEDFLGVLAASEKLFPPKNRAETMTSVMGEFLWYMVIEPVRVAVEKEIESNGKASEYRVKQIVDAVVEEQLKFWGSTDFSTGADQAFEDKLRRDQKQPIDSIIDAVFQSLPYFKKTRKSIVKLAPMVLCRHTTPQRTGIVVAGFGDDEVLPSIATYFVEFALPNGFLKYRPDGMSNDPDLARGSIVPFAQREMVDTFMSGIDPEFYALIDECLTALVEFYPGIVDQAFSSLSTADRLATKNVLRRAGAAELDRIKKKIEDCRRRDFAGPIINVVRMLPIDELAEMAESLVSLTSFKRKVSLQEETVGGPIDVAVISKGDGFVWIKRKHYFDAKYNSQYFENAKSKG